MKFRSALAISFLCTSAIVMSLATPLASAQTGTPYTFAIACNTGNTARAGDAGASWTFTDDGQLVGGGTAGCGINEKNGGTGTVPPNANGIVARLTIFQGNCEGDGFGSQSFAAGGQFSLKVTASCDSPLDHHGSASLTIST